MTPTAPTSNSHPIAAEFLLDYATGSAPEPIAVLVASHMALDAGSRDTVRRLEAAGGALLEDIAPADVTLTALDRVLDRLGPQDTPTPSATGSGLVPAPLRAYMPNGLESLAWHKRGFGVSEAVLPCAEAPYQLSLLRIKAGRSIPRHAHRGPELTLILDGGFSDQNGHYGRGDVCFADDTVEHRPVADPDRECLCVIVTGGPIRFKGFLGLILAPFMRG